MPVLGLLPVCSCVRKREKRETDKIDLLSHSVELLLCIQEPNNVVHEASCAAFTQLTGKAGSQLSPHLANILTPLINAARTHQGKDLSCLYEGIGTLADSVKSALEQHAHRQVIVLPLCDRFTLLPDDDKSIIPLMEV